MPVRRVVSSDRSAVRPNTVNLNERDLNKVLDAFDAGPGTRHNANRQFIRWPFRRATVRFELHGGADGGQQVSLRVACRNISCGGLSVLHSAYVHIGTRCTAHLPRDEHTAMPVSGRVVRCAHLSGTMHELGVAFDQEIDAKSFIPHDPFEDTFSVERVDESSLAGTVVYIDDSAMDQKLVRHFLRGTQIRLRTADTIDAGQALIDEGCELVITAYQLASGNGLDLVARLRSEGHHVPVILATGERGPEIRKRIRHADVAAVLTKPLEQPRLLRALVEYLADAQSAGVVRSSLPQDHPNHPLIATFIEELAKQAARLRHAVEAEQVEAARTVCMQIAVSAPSVGFQRLGELASEAAAVLLQTGNVAESRARLHSLLGSCAKVHG